MDHLFVFCPVLCIMAVHFLLKGCRSWIRQKNTRGHAVKSEGLPKGNTYYVVGGEGVLICFITSCTTSHKKKSKAELCIYIHPVSSLSCRASHFLAFSSRAIWHTVQGPQKVRHTQSLQMVPGMRCRSLIPVRMASRAPPITGKQQHSP